MKIQALQVGSIGTNCYILCDEAAKVCAVIDPGAEPELILSAAEKLDCTVDKILLTHGHYDHTGAVADLLPPVHGINFLVRRGKPLAERYIGNTNLMDEHRKKKLLKNYHPGKLPTDLSRPYFELSKGQDAVTQMETCDLNLWMVGDILLKADKMSMANSLELRVPFLDRKVFELASHIPTKCKVNANQTKIAMRGAAEKTIPAKTADKKKLGFPVPVRAWLRDEQYAGVVRKAFNTPAAEQFFRTKELNAMLDQHISGKRDNWRQIWCIFMFLVWYDEYFVKR